MKFDISSVFFTTSILLSALIHQGAEVRPNWKNVLRLDAESRLRANKRRGFDGTG